MALTDTQRIANLETRVNLLADKASEIIVAIDTAVVDNAPNLGVHPAAALAAARAALLPIGVALDALVDLSDADP